VPFFRYFFTHYDVYTVSVQFLVHGMDEAAEAAADAVAAIVAEGQRLNLAKFFFP
jgi:hypothetical protein